MLCSQPIDKHVILLVVSNGVIVNWEHPPHHRVNGQVLDVFIAKQIGIVLSHDVERMVEMCAQAYKAGYRISFVGC